MKLLLGCIVFCCFYLVKTEELPLSTVPDLKNVDHLDADEELPLPTVPYLEYFKEVYLNEDRMVLNESLHTYGPPMNYTELNLPGPELEVDENRFLHPNKFIPGESGTYTLRIRAITEYFSYNSRYEEIKIKKENDTEIPIIKGQFGEHFGNKNGDYYVRTIGYIIDEKGYRQFLLDLTKAETIFQDFESGGPDGPEGHKHGISSTVLGTLIGGNIG